MNTPLPLACPNCKQPTQPDDRFCHYCAYPLRQSCRACGQEAPIWARFCPNCAHPFLVPGARQEERRTLVGFGLPEGAGASSIPSAPAGPQSGALTTPTAPAGPQTGAPSVPTAPAGPQTGAPSVPTAPAGPQTGAPAVPSAPPPAQPGMPGVFSGHPGYPAGMVGRAVGKTTARSLASRLLGTAAGKVAAAVIAVTVVAAASTTVVVAVKGGKLPFLSAGAPLASPTPTLSQQSIYVSAQDGIYAFNASDGTQRWKYPISLEAAYEGPQLHIVDGAVYFILDKENINNETASTSTMYVLNAQNGRLLRQYAVPYFTLETGAYIPDFAIANGAIYLIGPGEVDALAASNGSPLWQHMCFCRNGSAPEVAKNVVYYVTGVSVIEALNTSNGQLLWSYDLGITPPGSLIGRFPNPVISNNTMYVVGEYTDMTFAVSLTTHTVIWSILPGGDGSGESIYAANGSVYVNAYSDPASLEALYALRADNGAPLWSKQNFSFAQMDANRLYGAASGSGGSPTVDFSALHFDGTDIWHTQLSGSLLYRSEAVVISTVVFVPTDTALYAVNAADGRLLWQAAVSGYLAGPS